MFLTFKLQLRVWLRDTPGKKYNTINILSVLKILSSSENVLTYCLSVIKAPFVFRKGFWYLCVSNEEVCEADIRVFVRVDCSNADMLMMWIFPYFFEPRILECLPSLAMLDYQVPAERRVMIMISGL